MVDILHRIAVEGSSPDDVYAALTTRERLAAWWTEDTQGDGDVGGELRFRFPEGGFDMEVEEAPRNGSARRSTGTCARTATGRS